MSVFSAIISLGIFFSVTAFLKWWLDHRRLRVFARKFKGPRGLPVLGILSTFIGKNNEEILQHILDYLGEFKSPVKVWVGPFLVLLVDDPEHLKTVLNSRSCLKKAYVYDFLDVTFGLMHAPAHIWRVHRKHLNACFNPKFLQTFLPSFNKSCRVLADRLAPLADAAAEFDINHAIGKCTLEMICATSLGIVHDYQGKDGDSFMESIETLAEAINQRIFNIFYHIPMIYKLSSVYQSEQKSWTEFRKVTHRAIQNANKSPISSDLKKPCTFVEQIYKMLAAVEGFKQEMVRPHIDTLVAAGNETSALTASFAILMLAIHQEVQEKALAELRDVFKSPEQEVTFEDLGRLKYLEMVLNETLRLFPITPFIGREVSEDLELEKGLVIPRGAMLMIPIFNIHRDPKSWGSDAQEFRPERFLPENATDRHAYSFIPFSNGPRNCIGWRYSMFAMKTMLCHLLRRYKFSSTLVMADLRLKLALDLKLVNRHLVSIERRTF